MLGRLLDLQEQWQHFFSTRHRQWGRVGSRAAANNAQEAGGLGPTSSLLPSLASVISKRSKGNATNKQFCSILDLFKAFYSLFLPICFFLLLMADLVVAVVRGRWSCSGYRKWLSDLQVQSCAGWCWRVCFVSWQAGWWWCKEETETASKRGEWRGTTLGLSGFCGGRCA